MIRIAVFSWHFLLINWLSQLVLRYHLKFLRTKSTMQDFVNTIPKALTTTYDYSKPWMDELPPLTMIWPKQWTNYFLTTLFTLEQLKNVPQFLSSSEYEANILDTFNFSAEKVQERLQHLNIYKYTRPDTLYPQILSTLEDKLAGPSTHTHIY